MFDEVASGETYISGMGQPLRPDRAVWP